MSSTNNSEFLLTDPSQTGKVAAIDQAFVSIDQVVAGTLSVDASAHATPYTVPYTAGDEPNVSKTAIRFACLRISGALAGAWTCYLPAGPSLRFFAINETTGGFAVTIMVSGQTGVTLANGKTQDMFLDGTDVIPVAAAI